MKFIETFRFLNAEIALNDEEYEVIVTVCIKEENDEIPFFSKPISVVSNNKMTGYEVDEQREQAVKKYIDSLNK